MLTYESYFVLGLVHWYVTDIFRRSHLKLSSKIIWKLAKYFLRV
jgi:hypothetical protein